MKMFITLKREKRINKMSNNKKQTLKNFNEINKQSLSYPISLIYLNIRSLRLHFNSFLVSVNNIISQIKFIILVETNITDAENNFYNIKGFNSIFLKRKKKGGGIVVYIAEHLSFNKVSLKTNSFEIIQLDVSIQNQISKSAKVGQARLYNTLHHMGIIGHFFNRLIKINMFKSYNLCINDVRTFPLKCLNSNF